MSYACVCMNMCMCICTYSTVNGINTHKHTDTRIEQHAIFACSFSVHFNLSINISQSYRALDLLSHSNGYTHTHTYTHTHSLPPPSEIHTHTYTHSPARTLIQAPFCISLITHLRVYKCMEHFQNRFDCMACAVDVIIHAYVNVYAKNMVQGA